MDLDPEPFNFAVWIRIKLIFIHIPALPAGLTPHCTTRTIIVHRSGLHSEGLNVYLYILKNFLSYNKTLKNQEKLSLDKKNYLLFNICGDYAIDRIKIMSSIVGYMW